MTQDQVVRPGPYQSALYPEYVPGDEARKFVAEGKLRKLERTARVLVFDD